MRNLRALLDLHGSRNACPEQTCSCTCLEKDAAPEVYAALDALITLAERPRANIYRWEIEQTIMIALRVR